MQVVRNINVIKPGMYRIESRTTQNRAPQLPQTYRNIDPRVSTSIGVTHRTNVSRPQTRNTQMKYKVVLNISQVKYKKTEVEDHHRISSVSNQTTSVTACNDSLKSKTSNVNVVCATCGKCVFNSNHDACVSKYLNDVNARTKKPKVVSISTRKPKSQVNKSVANYCKKTCSKFTVQGIQRVTIGCFMTKNESYNSSYSIVVSRCTKAHDEQYIDSMQFVEKYCGTVRLAMIQFALISWFYGDLVQGFIYDQQVSDYDNSDPDLQLQNVSPSADTTVPSQQELDLLFSPLYDEFFNAGASRVNKSSSPTDNSTQQDTLPSTNISPDNQNLQLHHLFMAKRQNNNDQHNLPTPFCTPCKQDDNLATDTDNFCMFALNMSTAELQKTLRKPMASGFYMDREAMQRKSFISLDAGL
ncbi:hypothetical protein Tco_1312331 [Tanacetum coccineum]